MPKELFVLDFDTENRPGFYWFDGQCTDMLMCVSWSWVHGAPDYFTSTYPRSIVMKYKPSRGLHMPSLEPFFKAVAFADIITGHNIRRHDIPLLNAHQVRTGDTPIEWPHIVDTLDHELWGGSTKGLSRSQANTADLFYLEQEKMTVNLPVWERAAAGQVDALQIVRERCESDVLMHMELYKRLTGGPYA